MSKTVTLRLSDQTYERFRTLAERENRPLSNFIETAASRYVETELFVDEFEMQEIQTNIALNRSLTQGVEDAKAGRGTLRLIFAYLRPRNFRKNSANFPPASLALFSKN